MNTIGIDLGTTNTVAATSSHLVELVADARSPGILPSVVAFPPSGETLIGEPARRRRAIDPRNTIASAKRVIGRSFTEYAAASFRERSAVTLIESPDGGVTFRTRAGGITPVEVAAWVVRHLAEVGRVSGARLDPSRYSAVVTVPVAFGPAQRMATLHAVRAAGFAEVRAVEEPVATAIAYLARSSLRYAVVYDLGGGTFDLAVVDCSKYPFRVVADRGDAYLGGDDVDRALAEVVADRVLRAHGWDLRSDSEVWDRLVVEAERAKLNLATTESTRIELDRVDPAAPPAVSAAVVDRALLRDRTHAMVRRTFSICDEVLGVAGIKAREVDAVFLAGGSTALPGLRDDVRAYFGKRARCDLDPMQVVAIGASLAAARPDLSGLLDAAVVR